MTMKRTISGMIGAGSLAHNRRDFIAENVDPNRGHLNICYQNENLKEVYKELFDDSVERYNVGKRKERQITNYYEKIRQGKQEKLFHEVIFQIGNCEDMAVGTPEGELAVKVLDEYVKDFEKRNPTLHVFSCYLHQDEATPHLHIDFVPYVTGWKGKGMDTRVSLKQALKSLGFQGGNKHDTELNQWINREKEVLAEIAIQHGIEWEQKGTHEEHLDVYNFKKKERKKEVQALEQEKEYLTVENEGLIAQIAEARADIQVLKDDKEQAVKDKEAAEKRAEKSEKELHSLEERREQLQPVMDHVIKEIKEYGTIKEYLPEAGALERAVTYRDKKIKPLFTQMKNKIAAMAAQVKELTKEAEKWKRKYQETKLAYGRVQRDLDTVRKEKQQLYDEKEHLQDVSDRYDRVLRVLGVNVVEDVVQQDIQEQKVLEEKRQMEQMPKGSIHERLAWGARKSEMENQQRKKNKTKNRGMER
ncbi:MAG: plasmid recombination protein [Lachnospiraceae bacterium]